MVPMQSPNQASIRPDNFLNEEKHTVQMQS